MKKTIKRIMKNQIRKQIKEIVLLCIILFAVSISMPAGLSAASDETGLFFKEADDFFRQMVKDKRIDYTFLYNYPQELGALLRRAQSVDSGALSGDEAKAYWINVYNLLVIRRVLDNYPIVSPQDVNGFFTRPFFTIGNKTYSLDDIEKGILFKTFPDPRLHFVLVCAAKGCPPLAPFAYKPDGLDRQLSAQTGSAMSDPLFVRLDRGKKKVGVSEIFRWYRSEFPSSSGGIIQYINKYRKTPVPTSFKVEYYTYDWSLNAPDKTGAGIPEVQSNLRTYTPAVLLPSGGYELKIFNNLYTQTAFRDANGDRVEITDRQSYFSMQVQFLYGVSKQRRVNLGFEVNLKSVFFDSAQGSPFNLFQFNGGDSQRTAVTTVGPKIKIAPFRSLPNFSIQSSILFPVASDLEGNKSGRPFLEFQRTVWWTQLFYDKLLSSRFQLFTELSFLLRLKSDFSFEDPQFVMPASVFINYFPVSKVTLYGMVQYAPTLTSSSTYYWQTGVGGKVQLTRTLELEALVTSFFAGSNAGAGVTYNIGIRYIKQ